jgi:hypothetical protein
MQELIGFSHISQALQYFKDVAKAIYGLKLFSVG